MKSTAHLRRLLAAVAVAGILSSSTFAADVYIGLASGEVWKGDSATGNFSYFACSCTGPVNSLALTDSRLIYGDANGLLAVTDLASGALLTFFLSPNDNSAMVADGTDLLIGGTNKTVVRMSSLTGQVSKTLATPADVQGMALHGDELLVGSATTQVHKGDKDAGGFQLLGICGGIVNSMTMVGTQLIVGDLTGKIYRKDLASPLPLVYYFDVPSDATALAFDGAALLIAGSNGKIFRANPATGQILATFTVPVPILSMAVGGVDCPEDLNGDGQIGQSDLGILLEAYGLGAGGDVDGDGDTDQSDLGALLAAFGLACE